MFLVKTYMCVTAVSDEMHEISPITSYLHLPHLFLGPVGIFLQHGSVQNIKKKHSALYFLLFNLCHYNNNVTVVVVMSVSLCHQCSCTQNSAQKSRILMNLANLCAIYKYVFNISLSPEIVDWSSITAPLKCSVVMTLRHFSSKFCSSGTCSSVSVVSRRCKTCEMQCCACCDFSKPDVFIQLEAPSWQVVRNSLVISGKKLFQHHGYTMSHVIRAVSSQNITIQICELPDTNVLDICPSNHQTLRR